MGFFTSTELRSLDDLLIHELKDLYDAEHRITDALPKLAEKAANPELKQAFQSHLQETKQQIGRLEAAFERLGRDAERTTCDAMVGLIQEGKAILEAKGDEHVLDAALIAAAQRVEHYEMAGYGTARSLARQLNQADIAELLQQTLDEEGAADHTLTSIAEQAVNPSAA